MPEKLSLEIISPQGTLFQGQVRQVCVQTPNGQICILPNHTPVFTKLAEGEIEIEKDSGHDSIVIASGFLEVINNTAKILSDYAVRAESIEEAKVLERKRKAEEKIRESQDRRDFTQASKDLRISLLELKVVQKMRRRHPKTP